jgi:hypothetical protein
VCKKSLAKNKQRKAAEGATVAQTAATDTAVMQTASTETPTEDIMSLVAV